MFKGSKWEISVGRFKATSKKRERKTLLLCQGLWRNHENIIFNRMLRELYKVYNAEGSSSEPAQKLLEGSLKYV